MDSNKSCSDYWIKKLDLVPHPGLETGFLREVYRDSHGVVGTAGANRSAATNIYFLHKKGN
jgi:predicted cupin superfamily sugar epimerase